MCLGHIQPISEAKSSCSWRTTALTTRAATSLPERLTDGKAGAGSSGTIIVTTWESEATAPRLAVIEVKELGNFTTTISTGCFLLMSAGYVASHLSHMRTRMMERSCKTA